MGACAGIILSELQKHVTSHATSHAFAPSNRSRSRVARSNVPSTLQLVKSPRCCRSFENIGAAKRHLHMLVLYFRDLPKDFVC